MTDIIPYIVFFYTIIAIFRFEKRQEEKIKTNKSGIKY